MIERLTGFPENAVAVVCRRRVTKADYDTVVVPAVIAALKTGDKLRLCYETAADFVGIEPSGIWEDFKIGMQHFTRWVTDVEWIRQALRLFSFLMPGEIRSFATSETAQARAWIVAVC